MKLIRVLDSKFTTAPPPPLPKKRTKWEGGGAPDVPAPDTSRDLETLNKCTIKSAKQKTAAPPLKNLSGLPLS